MPRLARAFGPKARPACFRGEHILTNMARKYRGSLTPANRDLVSSALLPVVG